MQSIKKLSKLINNRLEIIIAIIVIIIVIIAELSPFILVLKTKMKNLLQPETYGESTDDVSQGQRALKQASVYTFGIAVGDSATAQMEAIFLQTKALICLLLMSEQSQACVTRYCHTLIWSPSALL